MKKLSLKIRDSWCEKLSDKYFYNKDHELDSVFGVDNLFWKWWHRRFFTQGSVGKVNGNRNVPYLDKDDAKRNLNLNWWDNDWNSNYRFLVVRNFY